MTTGECVIPALEGKSALRFDRRSARDGRTRSDLSPVRRGARRSPRGRAVTAHRSGQDVTRVQSDIGVSINQAALDQIVGGGTP